MVEKNITEFDLLKMRNEISKEQQEARHQQNNSIQKVLNILDDFNVTIIKLEGTVSDGFSKQSARFTEQKHDAINDIKSRANKKFAGKPVEKLVYGFVGFILMGFITSLVSLIYIKGK